jgi:hypothetical protein
LTCTSIFFVGSMHELDWISHYVTNPWRVEDYIYAQKRKLGLGFRIVDLGPAEQCAIGIRMLCFFVIWPFS